MIKNGLISSLSHRFEATTQNLMITNKTKRNKNK